MTAPTPDRWGADKKFAGQRLDSTGPYYYNAMYFDMMGGLTGINLDQVLDALIRLVGLGFAKCSLIEGTAQRRPIEELTSDDLVRRCSGLSKEELREYPLYAHEYELEITEKRIEGDARGIYDSYRSLDWDLD